MPLRAAGPPGWRNKELRDRLGASPVAESIHVLGFLSEEQLKEQYLNCKAFVYPSLYEGFGLPVLEALCLDCMVVTSRGTVMQEIAGSCAMYFDPNGAADMAGKIAEVCKPDFDRGKYLAGRESVPRNYSWQESAAKLAALFSAVLGSKET